MKRIVTMLIALSLFAAPTAYATPGACSGHDGVDCLAGPNSNGKVICNDEWTGSSVLYSDIRDVCLVDFHPFIDVQDTHPNEEAILTMYEKAIIIGYDDFTFRPDAQINRVEFLKILIEGAGVTPDPSIYNNCFPDVANDWYAPYVCYAKEQNWVQGYEDGTFKPVNNVNKVEAIKMLVETQGFTVNENLIVAPFEDVAIDQWFAGYVDVAKNKGLLEETGTILSPATEMTRASITEMTYRALMIKENALASFSGFDQPIALEETISLSGNGTQVSDAFNLNEGLVVITANHIGSSNFIVKLLDTNSTSTDYLFNNIGNFDGKTALNISSSSEYVLDVDADGSWDFEIEQPKPASVIAPLSNMQGTGMTISDFFIVEEGITTFTMTHDGDSNFIVTLLDQNGNFEAMYVNDIGVYEGSNAQILDSGTYLLEIQADGNWTIDIEKLDSSISAPLVSSFSGTGDTATELFSLPAGLKTFTLTHDGDSNFIVDFLNENDPFGSLLANEIGAFDGSTAEYVDADNYIINIQADGNWTINIE